MPVCTTCNDTHRMTLGDRTVMCTRCPIPCQRCRSNNGTGAFCATTPCTCSCHARTTMTDPSLSPPSATFVGPSATLDEIKNAIGRDLTPAEVAPVAGVNELSECQQAVCMLLLADPKLLGRYFGLVMTSSTAMQNRQLVVYIDYLHTKRDRQLAKAVDASKFKLFPVEFVANKPAHIDLDDIEPISRVESFAIQDSIAETIRVQFESSRKGAARILREALGDEEYASFLMNIAGNIVHSLI